MASRGSASALCVSCQAICSAEGIDVLDPWARAHGYVRSPLRGWDRGGDWGITASLPLVELAVRWIAQREEVREACLRRSKLRQRGLRLRRRVRLESPPARREASRDPSLPGEDPVVGRALQLRPAGGQAEVGVEERPDGGLIGDPLGLAQRQEVPARVLLGE